MKSTLLAALCVAVVATGLVGQPARAQDQAILAAGTLYVPPVITIGAGEGLDFQNEDVLAHDVVSVDRNASGARLFRSRVLNRGDRDDIVGVEELDPGTYGYGCSLHGWMAGAIVVTEAGAVPPLPSAPDPGSGAGAIAVGGVVPAPTSVTTFGGNVYATSYVTGAVYEMPILPGGALGPAVEFARGFSSPLGVTFGPDGTLFVADSHASARDDRGNAGRVWALPPGGGDAAVVGEVVVDELPNGRHNTNGMHVKDGRLYITNGNSTDDGETGGDPEEPLSGTLLSVDVAARGLVVGSPTDPLPGDLTVEASGMRNVYDVAFRPGTNEGWLPTNGPDTQDPWGEDLLHMVDVAGPSADFGFPGCVYKPGPGGPTDPVWQQSIHPTDVCDGTQTDPEVTLGLHVSANGLAFGPEEGWDGDLYITEFGNFFGTAIVGHRVVRVPIDAAGVAGAPVDLFIGGTPLDLTFSPAGDMYVADFGASQILLVKAL